MTWLCHIETIAKRIETPHRPAVESVCRKCSSNDLAKPIASRHTRRGGSRRSEVID
jgi:hypothetical protein